MQIENLAVDGTHKLYAYSERQMVNHIIIIRLFCVNLNYQREEQQQQQQQTSPTDTHTEQKKKNYHKCDKSTTGKNCNHEKRRVRIHYTRTTLLFGYVYCQCFLFFGRFSFPGPHSTERTHQFTLIFGVGRMCRRKSHCQNV